MNKTITIKLGGINFYIDEDAYRELEHYLNAISTSLDPDSRAETLEDIEARIAELFLERQNTPNEVVDKQRVREIIDIMGQPEDYRMNDEEGASRKKHHTQSTKKLYRDVEHRNLGGVCAGLGHYFGISRIWVRIIFVILLFAGPSLLVFNTLHLIPGAGSILVIYIILWAVIPAARTTSQKLEMQGDTIDIDNIERKVKEEFSKARESAEKANYSGLERFFRGLGNVLLTLAKVLVIIIGVLFVLISGIVLLTIVFSSLFVGSLSFMDTNIIQDFRPIYLGIPNWLAYIATFLLVFIPFLLLFLAGLKILAHKRKIAGYNTVTVLVGLWILSLIPFIIYGMDPDRLSIVQLQKTDIENYDLSPQDTLVVSLYKHNHDMMLRDVHGETVRFNTDGSKFYPNVASLTLQSTNKKARLNIHQSLKGNGWKDYSTLDFGYHSKLKNDTLFLSNGIGTIIPHKNIDEVSVDLILYLPQNMVFKVDRDLVHFAQNIPGKYSGHYLKFEKGKLNCLDCTADNSTEAVETTSSSEKEKLKNDSTESEWYQEKTGP